MRRSSLRSPLLATALLLGAHGSLLAQAAPRVAPSGRATTEVNFSYPRDSAPAGAATPSIRIDYGQPHLRGRAVNTDSLVPFDRPWRTGANAATTLTTGLDLVIGGQRVPKGTYTVWTLPARTGWTLVLQRSATPGGTMQAAMIYDAANDAARIPLRQQTLATPVESLSMWLVPATGPGAARGELRLAWGTVQLATDWSVQ